MKTVTSKLRNARLIMIMMLCVSLLFVAALTSCNESAEEPDASEQAESATVEVLRLKSSVARGEKITTANFDKITLEASKTWIGAVSSPEDAIGKYALKDLEEGEFILSKYLSDTKPPEIAEKVILENKDMGFKDMGFIVVTEYLSANTGEDVGAKIQKVIDRNPKSVIYFPDGEYQTSIPIRTPADGDRSVSLKLSDNAVIKAHEDWEKGNGAVIRLGGKHERNTNYIAGSNYYLEGGTIDGSGIADGVSIDHGRETSVRDVTIINTNVGLHVKKGANGGSSDADIENIRIFGNGKVSSVGLKIQGWDNTYSNMRIANVQVGVYIDTAANLLRDIQCTYISTPRLQPNYTSSQGFFDSGDRNWYDNCTSTDFATGFYIASNRSKLISCVARWTDVQKDSGKQVAIAKDGKWNSLARSVVAEFTAPSDVCEYLSANPGGYGYITDPIFDVTAVKGSAYEEYLHGKIMWNK